GVVDEVVERVAAPALAELGGHALRERAEGRALADVELQRDGRAAAVLDRGDGLPRVFGVAVVGQDHAGAVLGQADRRVPPDARAGAGDDRDLVVVWHASSEPVWPLRA